MKAYHTSIKVPRGRGRAAALLLVVLITEHVAMRVAAVQSGRPSQQRSTLPAQNKPSKQPAASSGKRQADQTVQKRRDAPIRTSVVGPGKGASGTSAEASQVPSDGAWNIDQLLQTVEEDLKEGSFMANDKTIAESAKAASEEVTSTQKPAQPINSADLHIDREAVRKPEKERQAGMPKKGMRSNGAASSEKAGGAKSKQAGGKSTVDNQPEALRAKQYDSFQVGNADSGESEMPAGRSAAQRVESPGLRLTTRTKKPPANSRALQPEQNTRPARADAARPEEKGAGSGHLQDGVFEGSAHAWKLPGWGKHEVRPATKPAASSAGAIQDRPTALEMREKGSEQSAAKNGARQQGSGTQASPWHADKGAELGKSQNGVFEGSARAWNLALTDGAGEPKRDTLKHIVSQAHGNEPDKQAAGGTSDSILARVDPEEKYAVRAIVGAVELYKAHSLLCVGCAQFGWLKEAVDLFTTADKGFRFYCVDTDGPSITKLKRAHVEQKQWSFYKMDPFQDQLPRADLLLSRNIGEGMEPSKAIDLLENLAMSGATWLLLGSASRTQHAPSKGNSKQSKLYLSLQEAPFYLKEPLMVFSENRNSGGSGDAPEKQLLLYSGSHLRAQDFRAMRSRAKGMPDNPSA